MKLIPTEQCPRVTNKHYDGMIINIKSTTGYESYTISVIIISSYGTTRMQVSGVLQKGTNLMKFAAEIPKKKLLMYKLFSSDHSLKLFK